MKTKPVRFRDQHPRPAAVVKKERMKLLEQFRTTAWLAATQSWSNHCRCVAVNALGQKRTHHRARTEPENRRRHERQRRLQTTTLKSLALAKVGKSSSPKWNGIALEPKEV